MSLNPEVHGIAIFVFIFGFIAGAFGAGIPVSRNTFLKDKSLLEKIGVVTAISLACGIVAAFIWYMFSLHQS